MREREWIEERRMHNRHGEFRTLAKLKSHLFLQSGGSCTQCRDVFELRDFELDHVIPLALGGGDADQDLQLVCIACHAKKTAIDLRIIAAARVLEYVDTYRIWAGRDFMRQFYLTNFDAFKRTEAEHRQEQCRYKDGSWRHCNVPECRGVA